MGQYSLIEWTHHTFNPWWGCVKVSEACDHCYAEQLAARFNSAKWGKTTPRRVFGAKHWNDPIRWNKKAKLAKVQHRVFCSSMADVFEDRRDLDIERTKLWDLIEKTPNLNWLLLTKRPHKIGKLVKWTNNWPDNVWLGTTTEKQKWIDIRVPEILKHPARIHFVSAEPVLEQLDFTKYLTGTPKLDWVIGGGETGGGARAMHLAWARKMRDDCKKAGTEFHFKQWGDHNAQLIKVGKKQAGRRLDGRTWDGVPV
jgi:protein gp37